MELNNYEIIIRDIMGKQEEIKVVGKDRYDAILRLCKVRKASRIDEIINIREI